MTNSLKQIFATIMVAKLGSQFGKQFEVYKNLEDGGKRKQRLVL
jgi:hypothetical protein